MVNRLMQETRPYNIVSNRYHFDHETQEYEDRRRALEQAAQAYWETHVYDPVRTCYYDPEIEGQFQEARKQQQSIHGIHQLARLPPRVRNSEGMLYDITSVVPKDEKRLEEKDAIERSHLAAHAKIYEKEHEFKERGFQQQDLENTRALHRINPKKFETFSEYDILTTLDKNFHPPFLLPESDSQPQPESSPPDEQDVLYFDQQQAVPVRPSSPLQAAVLTSRPSSHQTSSSSSSSSSTSSSSSPLTPTMFYPGRSAAPYLPPLPPQPQPHTPSLIPPSTAPAPRPVPLTPSRPHSTSSPQSLVKRGEASRISVSRRGEGGELSGGGVGGNGNSNSNNSGSGVGESTPNYLRPIRIQATPVSGNENNRQPPTSNGRTSLVNRS
eukprot:TRINITY_DN4848_c0_g1_i4.p1 TRINITY_DN4848_c0_g1~~TRINITY_DN4848_c0_g1_i4.p1  ORF type:complete len:383 (+),score=56.08 TRINITY_DN4848_c0_g1_i4:172-1320(+)